MSTTLRIYRVSIDCPHGTCRRSAALFFEEGAVELCRALDAATVVGTVACTHHRHALVYEYRAADVAEAVFWEARASSGLRLDLTALNLAPVVEAPDIRPAPGPQFTEREREVCEKLMEAKTHARIARELGISVWTVRAHLENAAERIRAWDVSLPSTTAARTVLAFHNARRAA